MGASWQSLLSHPLLLIALALLVSFLAAAMGLTIGCSVGQTQVGLMFSLVVTPMIMFGCAYYPWSALSKFPIMQKAVLINPLVYASEGFRSALAPNFPHLPVAASLGALLAFDVGFLTAGLRQFRKRRCVRQLPGLRGETGLHAFYFYFLLLPLNRPLHPAAGSPLAMSRGGRRQRQQQRLVDGRHQVNRQILPQARR